MSKKDVSEALTQHGTSITHSEALLPLVYVPKDIELLLGLSKNSVNALLRNGQLRSVRFGRKWLIPRSALEEFLNSTRRQQ